MADKLDQLRDERDELQAVSSTLGERMQKMADAHADAEQDLSAEVKQLQLQLQDTEQVLMTSALHWYSMTRNGTVKL